MSRYRQDPLWQLQVVPTCKLESSLAPTLVFRLQRTKVFYCDHRYETQCKNSRGKINLSYTELP